jgi:transcription elongation GreA/GreB family factor
MTFKEIIHKHYAALIKERTEHLQKALQDLAYSAANETKSTAGDKHETALAMLQIEQENKRRQLSELQSQQAVFNKINPLISAKIVLSGSLVQTEKHYFFISVALGKIIVEGKTVFALSASSPLGKALLGHSTGDIVSLNENTYRILSVE